MTAFDFLYTGMFIFLLPILIINRRLRRGLILRLRQSLHSFRPTVRQGGNRRGVVVLHAVSVGEVVASLPLTQALKEEGYSVVVTTATERGYTTALKNGLEARFAPLDFSPSVRAFLREIKPSALILVELELWPNLIFWSHALGIPVVIVNGRISDESFRRYMWLKGSFLSTLSRVDMILSQNNLYSERFIMLGMPKEKVIMGGNLKYDSAPAKASENERKRVRLDIGASDDDILIIGGSTYFVEEKSLLDALCSLNSERRLRLLLAPRQADHFDRLIGEIEKRGLSYTTRSEKSNTDWDVYVIDTVGELVYLYAGCDIAFIGGTMFEGRGGHSVIEPAAVGLPVIIGENHYNFRDSVELLKAADALVVVKDDNELRKAFEELLNDARKRKEMGVSAATSIELSRGATRRIVECLKEILESE